MRCKRSFFLYLFIAYIFNINLTFSKDNLIPSYINGSNNNTAIDYQEIKKKLKKHKKSTKYIYKDKEVYNLKAQPEFDLFNYIKDIDTPNLDIPLSELKYRKPEFKIISTIYPLAKPIKIKPIISKYYNLAANQLQTEVTCPITPTVKEYSHPAPKSFNITNNLRRKVKSPFVAAGDIIYIKGNISDINCTPIANAIVNIWQADSYGRYDSKLEKHFLGNGTATSDNMGNFEFITILPASNKKDIAPHINISVHHNSFSPINSRMFFNRNILNNNDKTLQELDEFNKSLIIAEILPVNDKKLSEGFYMLFNLTFNGISAYKNIN